MQAVHIISDGDLALVVEHPETLRDSPENKEILKKLLHNLGMDIAFPIEVQHGTTHRLWDKSLYTGTRYVGVERTDKAWLRSGYASLEAKVAAKGDWSMVEELTSMRKGQLTTEGCDTLFEIGEE